MSEIPYEAAVKSCYSTWSDNYYEDYYSNKAAYPPVHRDIVRDLLDESGAANVLDAGCGPASMLRELPDRIDRYGFDLTPEMVEEARRILAEKGVPANHLWEGSVTDQRAYHAPAGDAPDGFDAAICIGVLPHIPAEEDLAVIGHLKNAIKPGGLVVVEARNQLFSLFTLNRYSFDFIRDELVRANEIRESAKGSGLDLEPLLEQLEKHYRMDLPPIRKGKEGEPGYDEVLSRTHNPHLLKGHFERTGFNDVKVLFYHFHCLPPLFEKEIPEFFREQSLKMEDPEDWRGYYMASAFLVAGTRP